VRGASRFEPNQLPQQVAAESKIRSSPVYAGQEIKPLKKRLFLRRAPAVSDRIEVTRQAGKTSAALKAKRKTLTFPWGHPDGYPLKE
jgi:hypothetical protein